MNRRIIATIAAVALAACADVSAPHIASKTSDLSLPGLGVQPRLPLSPVQVLIADAVAECSWWADGTEIYVGFDAAGTGYSTTSWYTMRTTDPTLNYDPATGLGATANLQKHGIPNKPVLSDPNFTPATDAGQRIIAAPQVYYCVAQSLRRLAPGASGAEALLLSGDDQLALLRATHQHVQLAIRLYARLQQLMSMPPYAPGAPISSSRGLAFAQAWLNSSSASPKEMAADFAAAVQLDVVVSKELFELFARNASARAPRPWELPAKAIASNEGFDTWGPESWRMRALDSLYGTNDSLSAEDDATAWYNADNYPATSAPLWPNPVDLGYRQVSTGGPRARQLLQLVRQQGAVYLVLGDSYYDPLFTPGDRRLSCSSYDLKISASYLYRLGEASLRHLEPNQIPEPAGDLSTYELWKRYRVTLDDARAAVEWLANAVGLSCVERYDADASWFRLKGGAYALSGTVRMALPLSNSGLDGSAITIALDSDVAFTARGTNVLAGHVAGRRSPAGNSQIFLASDNDDVENPMALSQPGAERAGSVQTLVAVRDALLAARLARKGQSRQNAEVFASLEPQVFELIDASIGSSSVSIEPQISTTQIWGANIAQHTLSADGKLLYWNIFVTNPSTDAWWHDASGVYDVVAIRNGEPAADLLVANGASQFGRSIESYVAPAIAAEYFSNSFAPATVVTTTDLKHDLEAGTRAMIALPYDTDPYDRWTFLYRHRPASGATDYRLLATGVSLADAHQVAWWGSALPAGSHHFATAGGSLNRSAARLIEGSVNDPVRPAYDAFGLRTDAVPADGSLLLGNSASQSSVAQLYLANARQAATDAQTAVSDAIRHLEKVSTSEAEQAISQAKGADLSSQEVKRMCGLKLKECELNLQSTKTLSAASLKLLTDFQTDCATNSDEYVKTFACLGATIVGHAQQDVDLPKEVVDHKDDASVPAFDDYRGGSLQSIYIEEWSALRAMNDEVGQIASTIKVAVARSREAAALFDRYGEAWKQACSKEAEETAIKAGFSVGATVGFPPSVSVNWSPGPLLAQQQKCSDLLKDANTQEAALNTASAEATKSVGDHTANVFALLGRVQLSSAAASKADGDEQLALSMVHTNAAMEAAAAQSSFGLYRITHDSDVWRAKALLESARRYAVLARRAIEARYVVDMSAMFEDEALVASPASWADSIYQNDLSMPSAVGLTSGSGSTGGVYPNHIIDYIGNLQRFVDGYAIQHPVAVTTSDSMLLSLPGPRGNRGPGARQFDPTEEQPSFRWSFYCPGATSCASGAGSAPWCPPLASATTTQPVAGACPTGIAPTRARLGFALDPWARASSGFYAPPESARFNVRWGRLTVNLVGTGVLDCAKDKKDPSACYASPFVPYDLTAIGPTIVADARGNLHDYAVPNIGIDGAKAIAMERWLDPLVEAWSKPYVAATERRELTDRPVAGAYLVEFALSPAVVLDAVERVQILMDTSYWVPEH